ncbi:MAG: PhoH family protein [Maricaulaceae bacterium]
MRPRPSKAPLTAKRLRDVDPTSTPVGDDTACSTASTAASWLDGVRRAVAPFEVSARDTPEGVKLVGDEPAVFVANKLLERFEGSPRALTRASARALDEAVREIIDLALRRDFAFRLAGVLRPVRALSFAQLSFMRDLLDKTQALVLGIGPSGAGKTHLAIAAGLSLLARDVVKHLIITKPHEFIDGEVVTPTIRAETRCDEQFAVFDDILHDLVGHEALNALIESQKLQIIPMGALRGRTFNQSFILVDEAQNMTVRKMRLAINRLGDKSRMVITGDPSQTELRTGETSGLAHLLGMIEGRDIGRFHRFEPAQMVRNETVAKLEALYERENLDDVA